MNEKIEKAIRVVRGGGFRALAAAVARRLSRPDSGHVPEFWTEYLSWLTFANAGMLERGNVYCFDYAIKNLPGDAPILEIGSFCGLSTNIIAYCKQRHNVKNKLFTCDKWVFEGAESGGSLDVSAGISHPEYREFVKESFIRNIRMFSRHDLPFAMEMFSDEFFTAWGNAEKHADVLGRELQMGGPISFAYIDGNHQYDQAKRDFQNCDKYLVPGGFILFDDSEDTSEWEVHKVAQEVLKSEKYALIAKNPNYFFQKK